MSAYVCYGRLNACVISGGFACTRDELPRELARVARPVIGDLISYSTYGSQEVAQMIAGQVLVLKAADHR
jgi:hypothetical protein